MNLVEPKTTDPFLTLGYVEMIKVFLHPINAVP